MPLEGRECAGYDEIFEVFAYKYPIYVVSKDRIRHLVRFDYALQRRRHITSKGGLIKLRDIGGLAVSDPRFMFSLLRHSVHVMRLCRVTQ